MRIGIFGGSFNPVHLGHLELAKCAFSEFNLSHLYFVPAFQSPLKSGKALLSCGARLKLLQKALKPYPYFSVSACEIQRQGKSYTVDTLRYFRSKAAKEDQLFFFAGADVLGSLGQWKSIENIFRLCRFVVATRPGHPLKPTDFPVIQMPFKALPISASTIRNRLIKKQCVNDLLPAGIVSDLEKFFQLCRSEQNQAKSRCMAKKNRVTKNRETRNRYKEKA